MHNDTRSSDRFEDLPSLVIAALAFLLPIFFIPSVGVPFQFTKIVLAGTVALGGLAYFAFGRLGKRKLALPMHPIMLSVIGIAAAYFLSTVFSSNPSVTLLGERIEPDTFGFVVIGVLLTFLAAAFLTNARQMLGVYVAILAAAGTLALMQVARMVFGTDFLSFGGVFGTPSATLMGTLHDSAIFFGLVAVLSLVTMVTLPLARNIRLIVVAALTASILLLAIVNLRSVWILVGLFALGTFVYSMMQGGFSLKKRRDANASAAAPISGVSLLVLVLACFFVFGGQGISRVIWSKINIGQVDIRPSWQTTLTVAQSSLAENPIFGSGPATFEKQWALYRPALLNQSIAWNTDFGAGVGYVPTSVISTGLIGFIAWLAFLGTFVVTGYAALTARTESNVMSEFFILSSYLGAGYLWIIALTSNPAPSLLLYAFLLTGIFIASLRFRERFPEFSIDFSANPRVGFLAALGLTIVFLGSLGGLIAMGQQYLSALYLQRAIVIVGQTGNIEAASDAIQTSLSLVETDRAYRLATDLGIANLNRMAQAATNPTDADRQAFQNELAETVNFARRATEIDNSDYANWLSLGAIYQSLVPLNIEGAYQNAKTALESAASYRPQSPAIVLAQAYLERAAKNADGARTFAQQALTLRPLYTEAIFLLAQLAVESNNLPEAIARVEAATMLEPQNPVIYFQLGLLRYSNENYAAAAQAFEQAVALNGSYANARYFLGLSYYRIDRVDQAIVQFEKVAELNPENAEVASILTNLRSGRDPFTNLQGAGTIEERQGPPIDEENESLGEASDAVIGEETLEE